MFHTTANTTRSILNNNENIVMRSKSINSAKSNGVTTMKKTSFDENSVKTPHNKKDSKGLGGGSQTTQRRRRALGDISNRKGSGAAANNGGGGKNGGVVLKQTTTTSKSKFPSSTTKKNRTTQVKFSKTSSTKSNNGNGGLLTTNKARLGGAIGESSIKSSSTNSESKQRSSSSNNTIAPTSTLSSTTTDEYDGIFEATTRWAQHEDESNRSVYDTVPKEELEMFDNYRDDLFDRHVKEDAERIRLENERDEERFMECMRVVHDNDEDDLGTGRLGFGELDNINDDLLADKLPWEIEDGEFDPAEERRLSGSDPLSLWGDVY